MLIAKFKSDDVKDKLNEYEDILGKKLPQQYKDFILKYNGGETPNTNYRVGHTSSDVKALYGLGSVKYSLDAVKLIEKNGISYLPVGCDSFGNELLLELSHGLVYFLNHENDSVEKIADSFKMFIDLCVSEEVNASSVKSVEQREAELIKKGRGNIITDALREMWKLEIERNTSINLEIVSF